MLFSSLIFLFVFLPATLLLYFLEHGRRRAQNLTLVILSLFFYAWGEPKFVLVMLLSILVNYGAGLLVARRRLVLAASIAFNIGLLVVFKYLDFFIGAVNSLFSLALPLPGIQLPIGISFFTFQAMSYVLDVRRGRGDVARNPLDVALYISLFPQLIAGPIVRYETIADQIMNRKASVADIVLGIQRFMTGLAKKVLIANNVAVAADHAFSMNGQTLSSGMAWIGIIAYTLQIYFDFSGYSDMAIGLGKMFGFHFPENFNHPYISKTAAEFWRRWHISLGTWFRDYVYIPLGGSRVGRARLVVNLFIVWSLTGLWHGASWNFVLWGLLYCVLLTAEKLFAIPGSGRAGTFFYRIFLLLCILFGWVLFRAENLEHVRYYVAGLCGMASPGASNGLALYFLREYWTFLAAGLFFSTPAAERIFRFMAERGGIAGKLGLHAPPVLNLCLFILCLSFLVYGSYNPFIYFNF